MDTSAPPDTTAPDAMTNADAASPDAAPEASCVSDAMPVAQTIRWAESAAYPLSVDHHATWVRTSSGGATYLYVAGGIRQGAGERLEAVYAQVHRAQIQADGTLGAWEPIAPLPLPVGFAGLAQTADRVYVVGGITEGPTGPRGSADVFIGEFDAQGAVTWRRGTRVTQTFVHPTVSVMGEQLVLIGGTNGQIAQARVFTSPLAADGSNGAWTVGPAMPAPRSHHAAVVFAGQVYLLGGFSGQPVGNMIEPLPDVLRSTTDATGAITGWEVAGTLDDTPSTHSSFVHNGYAYIVGGLTTMFEARVRRAPFRCDGTVGAFEDVDAPLPVPHSHVHQTPNHNGRVYSVGGRIAPGGTSFPRVFIGTWQ